MLLNHGKYVAGILLSGLVNGALAGAWVVPLGDAYVELNVQTFRATSAYDGGGERRANPNGGVYREVRTEMKSEIGIFPYTNLLLAIPYKNGRYTDRNVSLRNGDVEYVGLGVKYLFTQDRKPLKFSGQFTARLPTCNANDQPALGRCEVDVETRGILSIAFWNIPGLNQSRAYASAELGYRHRNGIPADEIPYFVETAANFYGPVWIKGTVDGVKSRPFGGGAVEDYHKWGLSVLIARNPADRSQGRRPGVEVGIGEVFAGRNTGAGRTAFIKVFHQF